MLWRLQVKNFALIEEAELEFGKGLNILTGETGAGKSILIDAVTAALGGKVSAGMIRTGTPFAYIELVFVIEEEKKIQALKELGVELEEDHTLILSRKIMPGRSNCKVNDESLTIAKVKKITQILIDIHGQHEHQSLLYKYKHLEILDTYAQLALKEKKEEMAQAYQEYQIAKKKLENFTLKEEDRIREADFCQYEIEEIEQASLKEGEEEELVLRYKKASHAKSILEALTTCSFLLGYDSEKGAGESVGQALKTLQEVFRYDEQLEGAISQLSDIESILSDVNHEISVQIEAAGYEDTQFNELSARLDLIRSLQAKYGRNYKEIMEGLEKRRERLEELNHYELNRQKTLEKIEKAKEKALIIAEKISKIRQKAARELTEIIENSLKELNFLQVSFEICLTRTNHLSENGNDEIEFMISTNPGEPVRSISEVASGGELSRIMLAVKTVLADSDEIPTLIFDEIDTGISGRTAQQVSEKLSYIGRKHQVLCITHLPQIAAMADEHFLIEKSVSSKKTTTKITHLLTEDSVNELARLLGGAKITKTVWENALEMKELANQSRKF